MPTQPWTREHTQWGGARTRPSVRPRTQPPRRGGPPPDEPDEPDDPGDELDMHDAIDDERGDIVAALRRDGADPDTQAAYTKARTYHTDKSGFRLETRGESLGTSWGEIDRNGKKWKVSETDKFTLKEVKDRPADLTPRHRVNPVAAAHAREAARDAAMAAAVARLPSRAEQDAAVDRAAENHRRMVSAGMSQEEIDRVRFTAAGEIESRSVLRRLRELEDAIAARDELEEGGVEGGDSGNDTEVYDAAGRVPPPPPAVVAPIVPFAAPPPPRRFRAFREASPARPAGPRRSGRERIPVGFYDPVLGKGMSGVGWDWGDEN